MKLDISCGLCSEDTEIEFEAYEWVVSHDTIYEDKAFCPKHSIIDEWRHAQCPGCVGSWGDCGLWESFAFRGATITEGQLKQIECGTCPFRINGTFGFSGGQFIDMDLADKAPDESGVALAVAIREYVERYA